MSKSIRVPRSKGVSGAGLGLQFYLMSNLANYSPYNKTYKFILFQNQAYHERNKRNASPCVHTNLRHSLSRHKSPSKNPEKFESFVSSPKHPDTPDVRSSCSSMLFEKKREINRVALSQERRVIHKHQSYQKFRSQKISQENASMVSRIIGSECQILKNDQTGKSFKNHLRYRNIRGRYNEQGQRKDVLALGDSLLLCPTLREYHDVGLGHKFVERDLSMSLKPMTAQGSPRKRAQSNFGGNFSDING